MTQAANLAALGTNAGTTGILPAAGGGTAGTAGVTGFKNRLINGGMVIDQRYSGASVTPTTSQYIVDRWTTNIPVASKLTFQQNAGSVTPPAGFTNYLGATTAVAYSIGSSDAFDIRQLIEGYNVADLGWGTANAKTVTLSFWVRSSLTGTFGGAISNASFAYSYPFSYTISSANTWTQVSVTITGATSGTWVTNNGNGMYVFFSIGTGATYSGTPGAWAATGYTSCTGSTSILGTLGATFYLTGVQLEVGSAATNFDVRSYGTELGLCQRYYYQYAGTAGEGGDASQEWMYPLNRDNTYRRTTIRHPVTMRSIPTVSSLSMRINDATNVTGSTQYLSTASWSATYSPSSTGDYMYLNDYKISAEL